MSSEKGHLGWNLQPGGGFRRFGGVPGINSRRFFGPEILGNAPINLYV